ncbi:MAG: SDR family oxidoreductase [Bacillota bacterium]|nr:SDR family oxidoreductase [Bacillota bacterium]
MTRCVVVTGASSGIGYAIATRLHEAGWTVIGVSRSLPKQPYGFAYVTADLTKEEDVVRAVRERILSDHAKIDALVNCAGMGISGAIEETALSEVKRQFDVNLFGTFTITKELLPALRAARGRIVNISSVAAELAIPFQAFYSMSKAAMNAFTDTLRLELKPLGVQACAVLPGDTATGFTQNREKSASRTGVYDARVTRSVKRMEHDETAGVSPDAVAKVVARVLNKRKMPPQVAVGFQYKLFLFLKKILPKRLVEAVVYGMYGK